MLRPREWPIAVKVPLAVACLMILVGLVLSQQVLTRLGETQARQFEDLAQSYLDGLSSAIAPAVLREDVWETFDAIDRAQSIQKGLMPLETIVANADGRVIAASDPRQHPVFSRIALASPDSRDFQFEAGADEARAIKHLGYPGRSVGVITARFDTRHLASERRSVLVALIATNGALTLTLAAAGWFVVSLMLRPVRTLTDHLGAASEGGAEPIEDAVIHGQGGEFRRLFVAYNGLVASMRERERLTRRLADEERLGSLGRLASSLAHEINNPLGGLFNALSTIRTHGHLPEVRGRALGLLDRGLVGIRDVVRTTLAVYRADKESRTLAAVDIDDLQLLISPEARRKSVEIGWSNQMPAMLPLPSTPLRQAVLNVLLNAISAAPDGSCVDLLAHADRGILSIVVRDRGSGMPSEAIDTLTRASECAPPGPGLGLWTTQRLVNDLGGRIEVEPAREGGTLVRLLIPLTITEDLQDVA
jgi:signal transduction histidine kinase